MLRMIYLREVLGAVLFFFASPMCLHAQLLPFTDTFEDGSATDGFPGTWSPGGGPGGTREVTNGDYIISHSDLASSYVEESSSVSDVSIRTQLRILETNGWVWTGVFARSPSFASYWGAISETGEIAVGESFEGGSANTRGRGVFTGINPLTTDVLLQFDVIADEISLTAWAEGEEKPSVPQLTFQDDTIASGPFGVIMNTSTPSAVSFRWLEAVPDASTPLLADHQGPVALQAGDADQDLDFDQLDLVQVQIAAKYLTGQPATWGEGDWNAAPGGSVGSPPTGDGMFDQLDIISSLAPGHYLSGPYAAIRSDGQSNDGQTSIVYDPGSGEIAVDAPSGAELTSINIDSAAGIFTGVPARNLGNSLDNDSDSNIFKATFGGSFGSLSFGNVAQASLTEEFILDDLTIIGSMAGGGDLGNVDLVYVPEPTSVLLLWVGMAIGLVHFRCCNSLTPTRE